MAEIHARKIDRNQIDTWIENDLIFEGDIKLDKNLNICGQISGTIESIGDIHIAKNSVIVANISSQGSIYILGEVRGNINAVNRVELASESSLDGDVITGKMVIENGCYFNGTCKMRNNDN